MNNFIKLNWFTDNFLPFLNWINGYKIEYLKYDIIAGFAVAIILIPQSMAYAMLAGLPPVYGLYSAAITPILGAMWGSLRQLSTGPVAIKSLLVLTTVSVFAEPGSPEYVEMAILLAFMVGIIYLIIGLLKMGIIMSFVSHSSVKGFTSAAALIIISTQLPHILGISLPHTDYVVPTFIYLFRNIGDLHLLTLFIGLSSIIIIYIVQKINKTIPPGLIALFIVTLIVYIFQLDKAGVAVLGFTQSGLPGIHIPNLDTEIISSLIGPAIVISLISFVETYSITKMISKETKQNVDVNQEFIGQGMANFIGSFFYSLPVSGSFTRTAVNFASGAKTALSSIITTIIVIISLLFLTKIFIYIPKAALSAMIISAVILLFHPFEVFRLWKKNRDDGIVAIGVFGISLVAKPDYALLIGVMISFGFFLWKTMHPRIVRITRDPKHDMFLNADEHEKPDCPQILQLRSDNAIFFANAEYTIDHMLERVDEIKTEVKFLIVDFQVVSFVDMTGVEELTRFKEELESRGITLIITHSHIPVIETFKSSGFMNCLESGCLIQKQGDAISFVFDRLNHDYCKNICPLELFRECPSVK